MPTDIATLQSLELFQELQPDEIDEIAALANPMRITEGEVLTRRNDPAHSFYVVISGNYMIYFKEGRAFTIHEKGEIIGMATVITPFRYRGTTVALTDGEVLRIAGNKFLETVQNNSSLAEKLMRRINDALARRAPIAEVPKAEAVDHS